MNPDTIARIFHEISFQKPDTRISASAVGLSADYMAQFVLEAVHRANEARLHENPEISGLASAQTGAAPTADSAGPEEETEDPDISAGDSEIGPDTLDARHLRQIAGVLVLDF